MSATMVTLLCVLAALLVITSAEISHESVSHAIDATEAVVRSTTEFVINRNLMDKEYELLFPKKWAEHLAYLSVEVSSEKLKTSAPVSNGNYTSIKVELPESGERFKLVTKGVFTQMLRPYPAAITQQEPQLVVLDASHFVLTPYKSNTQKTSIRINSKTVENVDRLSPTTIKDDQVVFGPYSDVAAFQYSPAVVHFLSTAPFAQFRSLHREVEVSHWGAVSYEEVIELVHDGAKLTGGFSRLDFMKSRGQGHGYRSLFARLPATASNVYYRDQIGNISTSSLQLHRDYQDLAINTRFPLFGGWQTQFYIGYTVPAENVLTITDDGSYRLRVPYNTVFEEVWVKESELKVILPEGSTDIDVQLPQDYDATVDRSVRFTYLDSTANGGRPVIVIHSKNLVSEHSKPLVITYKFDSRRVWVEPLMVVSAIFVLFVIMSTIAACLKPSKSEKKTA